MKKKHNAALSTILVLLSLGLVGGAGYLLWREMPKKAPDTSVSTLDTGSVFSSASTVEPEREPAYEGDKSAPVEASSSSAASSSAAASSSQTEQPAAGDTNAQKAQALLESMTLEEKICQLFYTTPESLTGYDTVTMAGDATKQALEKTPVGGLIYFSKNLVDRDQTAAMLANTKTYGKIPVFLGVDEEGGTVSRIGSNAAMGGTKIDSMGSYGQKGDPSAVYQAGTAIADELTGLGFNMDFAPVADVAENSSSVIGSRSFGTDPKLCASLVSVMVKSLTDGKIVSCLKHFPGYGSATGDDHKGSASVTKTLDELESVDFLPFQAGISDGVPFVLVSHLSVPSVTGDDTPSDLSSKIVTDLLRTELGFTGVIVTDSQQMESITDVYSSGDAAVAALQAGADMVLMPQDLAAAVSGVQDAVSSGKLTESRINESVLRILTVKYQFGILAG
jgi:beta-N-acetylhexosaminidase